jgi:hypothetical protein
MKRQISIAIMIALCLPVVFATDLGVNYYHETMMTETNEKYIPRTIAEVGNDLDDIRGVSSHVKLFMNPFVDSNAAWVEEVNTVAKQKGFHTVVTMMVDRQTITAENWDDYANRVVGACQQFAGKADEIHVGNEITLHSSLARDDIKNRVVTLMDRCQQVFPGTVSYQEFWYANQVWEGYPNRIYFMMYENFNEFQGNMAMLQQKFPNAAIGEWGEDQLEGSVRHDEAWQKDQIQQRWNIINQANVPIAYLFTYREPNVEAFGMIRPDGTHKPLWEVFGGASQPPAPVCTPSAEVADGIDNDCDGQVDEDLPTTPTCTPTTEVLDGVDNDCNGTVDDVAPVSSTGNATNETNTTTEPTNSGGSSGGSSRRRSSGGGSRGLYVEGTGAYRANAAPVSTVSYDPALMDAVEADESVRVRVTYADTNTPSAEATAMLLERYDTTDIEVVEMHENGFTADINREAFMRLTRDRRIERITAADQLSADVATEETDAEVETQVSEDTAEESEEQVDEVQEEPVAEDTRSEARPTDAPVQSEPVVVAPQQSQGFFARIWSFLGSIF